MPKSTRNQLALLLMALTFFGGYFIHSAAESLWWHQNSNAGGLGFAAVIFLVTAGGLYAVTYLEDENK